MTDLPVDKERREEIAIPAIEIRILGNFELFQRGSGTLVQIPSKKARALLTVLASAPRFQESRSRLSTILWGGRTEEQARQSLRQLLSNFRRDIGEQVSSIVVSDDTTIALNPKRVIVDRTALVSIPSGAGIAELASVADSWRGEFGSGLELGEADFDDWLQSERTRLRETVVSVFDRLVRELASAGRHDEALTRATALLAIDPLREETHRLVIAEEAVVSGRASAMMRFESFRILLRDELSVRPEPATLQLVDRLRDSPSSKTSNDGSHHETQAESAAAVLPPVASDTMAKTGRFGALARWQRYTAIAAILVAVAWVAWISAGKFREIDQTRISYIGENSGRVSVVVVPFEMPAGSDDLKPAAGLLEAETKLAFSRGNQLSIVEFPEKESSRDTMSLGRLLRVRYVVKTSVSATPSGFSADVKLFDSATGVSLWSAPIPVEQERQVKFAREFYRYIYAEIALHRARVLSNTARDSTEELFWRAEASQIRTRIGTADPTVVDLYETILKREPDHLFALIGYSNYLLLKVAREINTNRENDLKRAEELLLYAKALAPNLAEIIYKQGLLNKLLRKPEQSLLDFERASRLDPTHWHSAAQRAHMKIFLGRFEEAYDEMEKTTPYLLPDIAAAETAYIAAETALVLDHAERAVSYLELAIAGNPTVVRIQALYAAALQLAGREPEAKQAAARARELGAAYTPEVMARRGGGVNANERYKAARDHYVEAFRTALAASSID